MLVFIAEIAVAVALAGVEGNLEHAGSLVPAIAYKLPQRGYGIATQVGEYLDKLQQHVHIGTLHRRDEPQLDG